MTSARQVVRSFRRRVFRGTKSYWDHRYLKGGTSGPGSYGRFARFKAGFLNALVRDDHVESVIEFGCGDGNQLLLAEYPDYLGLDISRRALSRCERLFADDSSKRFAPYDPATFVPMPTADLALSLDVILHLVEPDLFETHLVHLFGSSRRLVAIYGSDVDIPRSETAAHVSFRRFTPIIEQRFPGWTLERTVPGIEPSERGGVRTDFFVYRAV